ncbi:MAG: putative maltokinase, partial [Steroidobacteraceae bacterium]
LDFVRPQNRKILAYLRTYQNETILCVANLAQSAQSVELDLSRFKGRVPVELMGRNAFPPIGDLPYFLTLQAHGFFWLLLSESESPPAWHVERLPATELPVLVLTEGLNTFLHGADGTDRNTARRTLQQFQDEVLPEFVKQRRWFAGKGAPIARAQLVERTPWRTTRGEWLLAASLMQFADGTQQRYFLPLGTTWEDVESGTLRTTEWTLAKVRQHARAGVLVDAFADPGFCLAIVEGMQRGERIAMENGEIRFEPTHALEELVARGVEPVQHLGREQSNTAVILGDGLFLKAYRQARSGINPDAEVAGYLTEAGFARIPRLGGTLQMVVNGETTLLLALFAYVRNQGDGWGYALNHLERYATELLADASKRSEQPHMLFLAQMRTLGLRIGELHATLARSTTNAAFAPEFIDANDMRAWTERVEHDVDETLQLLQSRLASLSDEQRADAQALLDAREALLTRIRAASAKPVRAVKTRYHGDLHLGQILLCADDFLITDFEGEPARPLEERRRKHSALIDVAGMLRSFDYVRAVALDRALTGRPDARDALAPAFDSWYRASVSAFLEGYRGGLSGALVWPEEDGDAQRLIALFQIEKALYEVRYEASNRPNWIGIPVRGLMRLLA